MSYRESNYSSRSRESRRGFKRNFDDVVVVEDYEEPNDQPPQQQQQYEYEQPPHDQYNMSRERPQEQPKPPKPSPNHPKRNTKARLFVANLPFKMSENEFQDLFKDYKVMETILVKDKGFGFVQCFTREEAMKIQQEMTMKEVMGKPLHIKFCVPTAAIRVKNLNPFVTNELLYEAFSMFGEVDRAVVIADERGKSVGEGIVEFSSKKGYYAATRACNEGCFLLTSSIQPVIVEDYVPLDDEGGVSDSSFNQYNRGFFEEREKPPRVVYPGNFEYEVSMRWKQLFEWEKSRKAAIEQEVNEQRTKINQHIEADFLEYQANMLREQLRHMEEKSKRIKQELTLRDPRDEVWQDQRAGRPNDLYQRHPNEGMWRSEINPKQEPTETSSYQTGPYPGYNGRDNPSLGIGGYSDQPLAADRKIGYGNDDGAPPPPDTSLPPPPMPPQAGATATPDDTPLYKQ